MLDMIGILLWILAMFLPILLNLLLRRWISLSIQRLPEGDDEEDRDDTPIDTPIPKEFRDCQEEISRVRAEGGKVTRPDLDRMMAEYLDAKDLSTRVSIEAQIKRDSRPPKA